MQLIKILKPKMLRQFSKSSQNIKLHLGITTQT